MIILCELCDARCICYEQWMDHILTESHQEVTKSNMDIWDQDLNERSMLVTITSSIKPKTADFCWYFASYGLVSDVYFDPDMEFCVVQLDKRDYVLKALQMNHKIADSPVSIRWKVDVSREEWLTLTLKNSEESKATAKDKLFDESFRQQHEEFVYRFKSLSLDMQLEHFIRGMKLKADEVATRQQLLIQLKCILNKDFPDCVLYAHGSTVLGIGESTSVLDVYLDCLGTTLPEGTPLKREFFPLPSKHEIVEQIIERLSRLNQSENYCYDMVAVSSVKEPKISFTHRKTGVKCKFTLENLMPVKTTNVIRFLMKLDPRIEPLMVLIRYWASFNMLTGDNLLSNYSLNLLIIVFLVRQKIIPSIAALQWLSDRDRTTEVCGWDTSYCSNREKVAKFMHSRNGPQEYEKHCITEAPTAKAILILFSQFCKQFARMDFELNVVCPFVGDYLPKRFFIPGNEPGLPDSMDGYKNWASLRRPEARFNINSAICIQDPFQLSSNVAEGCSQVSVWKFQLRCSDTEENLHNVLNNNSPRLMNIFTSHSMYKSRTTCHDQDTSTHSSMNNSGDSFHNFVCPNVKELYQPVHKSAHNLKAPSVDRDPELTFKYSRLSNDSKINVPKSSNLFDSHYNTSDEFPKRGKTDMFGDYLYEDISVKRRKVVTVAEEAFLRRREKRRGKVRSDIDIHESLQNPRSNNPNVPNYYLDRHPAFNQDMNKTSHNSHLINSNETKSTLFGNPVCFKIKPSTTQKDTSNKYRSDYM